MARAGNLDEDTISIHAPAWGATRALHLDITINNISIHAPAWGATARTSSRHNYQ